MNIIERIRAYGRRCVNLAKRKSNQDNESTEEMFYKDWYLKDTENKTVSEDDSIKLFAQETELIDIDFEDMQYFCDDGTERMDKNDDDTELLDFTDDIAEVFFLKE